jgi:hypothetical protein
VAGEKQGTIGFGVNLRMGLFRHLGKAAFGVVEGMRRFTIVALSGLLLSSCGTEYVHQKLTIHVMTPTGMISASSVLQVSYQPPLLKGPAAGFDRATITRSGEAVVLDVGGGHYLFVLLKGAPDPWSVFYPKQSPQGVIGNFKTMIGQTRELTPKQYPLLVTFGDISDPASVKRVDPNNLELAFGPGYALQSITLSLTDEPVTTGEVEKVLPCLTTGNPCIPLHGNLPYGDPMRNILNSAFRSK